MFGMPALKPGVIFFGNDQYYQWRDGEKGLPGSTALGFARYPLQAMCERGCGPDETVRSATYTLEVPMTSEEAFSRILDSYSLTDRNPFELFRRGPGVKRGMHPFSSIGVGGNRLTRGEAGSVGQLCIELDFLLFVMHLASFHLFLLVSWVGASDSSHLQHRFGVSI